MPKKSKQYKVGQKIEGSELVYLGEAGMIPREKDPSRKDRHCYFKCPDCEVKFETRLERAVRGVVVTCPDCAKKRVHKPRYKRNLRKIWNGMKSRCNPDRKHISSDRYEHRGIKVCEQWNNNFEAFKEYILLCEFDWENYDLQIERIDNNGDYEPGNIMFTDQENQANNRGSNKHVLLNGVKMTQAQAAKKIGKSPAMMCNWKKGKNLSTKPKGLVFLP